MTTFPQIGQATLEEGQQGAAVTVNTALLALDALIFSAVLSQETAPPVSPAEADRHLVIATATGVFATHENDIALYWNAAWVYYTPQAGWRVKDLETGQQFEFDGTDWVPQRGVLWAFSTATISWNNIPLAVTEWKAATAQRRIEDLRGKTRIRFSNVCMALDSAVAGTKIAVQYSDDDGATWAYCDSAGANAGPNILVDGSVLAAGNALTGSWVNLDAAAKIATCQLRVVGLDGDGALSDPQFGFVEIEIQ